MSKDNLLKIAKIKNAEICLDNENLGHYTVFDEERNNRGWDIVYNGTLYGVSGGFYFLSASAEGIAISRSTSFKYVDASTYTEVVVKYRYVKNRYDSIATEGKIQFKTASDSIFDDDKSLSFEVIPDGKWHSYRIEMAPLNTWVGYITNLKIIFATNGQQEDEIFLEYIKIQNPQFTFSSEGYEEDTTIVNDSFNTQVLGSNPQNWSLVDVGTGRDVSIVEDPENILNRVVLLANTVGGNGGPSIVRLTNKDIQRGFFSCKVRVTGNEGKLSLIQNVSLSQDILELKFDSSGYIKYRKASSIYEDFDTPFAFNVNEWISILLTFDGLIGTFDTYINGEAVGGSLPYIFSGNVVAIKFENEGIAINSMYVDDVALIETLEVSDCPGKGKRGELIGEEVIFSKKNIILDQNDSFILNINNYGNVVIRLPAKNGLDYYSLRDLLEKEISKLDIGGYSHCEVDYINSRYRIRSGTYGYDSSVIVMVDNASTLATELGFTENAVSTAGRDSSKAFNFSNAFRARTSELHSLRDTNSNKVSLVHDPSRYAVEIGAKNSGTLSRRKKVSGINKTFIDFNHKATDGGNIDEVFFHGILPFEPRVKLEGFNGIANGKYFHTGVFDLKPYNVVTGDLLIINEPGYEGNGTYRITVPLGSHSNIVTIEDSVFLPNGSDLNYRISNVAKIKHFRPKHDGTFDLVNESEVGLEDSGLYTVNHDTYKIKVDWSVQKGDCIGIYNATYLYAGNYDDQVLLDAVYLEEEGDLLGSNIVVGTPIGQGINGIGLYGTSNLKQTKAVYDIEFDNLESIEYIDIKGQERVERKEYNLCTAIDSGFSLTPVVTGTHLHHVLRLSDATPLVFEHPNVAYNTASLTDGEKFASNGYLGVFEQDVEGASYFYIDGDGEFVGIEEFPDGGPYDHDYISDYPSDPFDMLMTWDVPKDIYKLNVYFKEFPHLDGYFLEWRNDGISVFDSDRLGFERIGIGNTSEFVKVTLDDLVIDPAVVSSSSSFYRHLQTVFDGYITDSHLEVGRSYTTFFRNPHTVLSKEFDSIRTTAFNFGCIHHQSTKISEIELMSYMDSKTSIDSSIELYFAIDETTFQRIDPTTIDDSTLRYRLNFPTNKLRIVVTPTNVMELEYINLVVSDDYVRYASGENAVPTKSVDLDIEKGQESEPVKVTITNRTCQTASLELSVSTKELSDAIIVKSSLNTEEDVVYPEIGPNGIIIQDPDYDLPVIDNVAINAQCYALKNLAINKKYYVSEEFVSESDGFLSLIDNFKWEQVYTNFPQGAGGAGSGDIGLKFPGFTAAPLSGFVGYPYSDIVARLFSRWYVEESFSAFVIASYDPRAGKTLAMGSEIGVVDLTGRIISVRKLVAYARAISGRRSWADYEVYDSKTGVIASERSFCESFCGPPFGSVDHTEPYYLSITRTKTSYSDILRISYVDNINGTGTFQWGESEYYEIDLAALTTPLVGPLRIVIGNLWGTTHLDGVGLPGAEGTYVKIHNFSFGGASSFAEYRQIGFTNPRLTGDAGEVVVDNKLTSIPGSVKAVALDLGKPYYLDIIQNYTVNGRNLWGMLSAQYSSSNVDDIEDVEWGNSTPLNARWLLFQEASVPVTQSGGLTYLDTLRIYPEITQKVQSEIYNSEWVSLGTILSDGDSNTFVSQTEHPVIAVRLANQFETGNYRLLGQDGKEFKGRSLRFNGWFEPMQTQSYSITNAPEAVIWEEWVDYEEDNKRIKPLKWLAFRNKTFNIADGESGQEYAASVVVSTLGVNADAAGQVNDRVDFTEYKEWFTADYKGVRDLAEVESTDLPYVGTLYWASDLHYVGGDAVGDPYYAFDGDDSSYVGLQTVPMYLWRMFGTVVATSGDNTLELDDSPIGDLVLTGESELSLEMSYEEKLVDGVELVLDSSTTVIPNTIAVQKFTGSDPYNDTHWQTVVTETNLAEIVEEGSGVDTIYVVEFNGGEPFRVYFDESITMSGIRFVISDVEYLNDTDKAVAVASCKALQYVDQSTQPIVTISNDSVVRDGGRQSLKLTYLAGNNESVKIALGGALSLEADTLWSVQDYLTISFKVDKSELLDFSKSFISIGTDEDYYYKWSLEGIEAELGNELSQYNLKFLNAPIKGVGTINYNTPGREQFESKVDFKNGPLTFFEITLKPKSTTTEDFNIWLDNVHITRENFTVQGINKTCYLNNSELIYYPVTGIGLEKGYFEAVITPDWDNRFGTTFKEEEAFTIFTMINDYDETFSVFYEERLGLQIAVTIGSSKTYFNPGHILALDKYDPIKVGIAWDSSGGLSDKESDANVQIWLDDVYIGYFIGNWYPTPTKNTYFFIGSKAYFPDIASYASELLFGGEGITLLPETYSLHGGIENLMLASEPVRISYSDLQELKDKIYVSLDGINYVPGTDESLPFIINSVPAGDSISVWVKSNFPKDTTNMGRIAFLRTRWRIS